MKIEYTIPLWGMIAAAIPLLITFIGGVIKLIYKQNNHENAIKLLQDKMEELEEDVEGKHRKLYDEIKKLDDKFSEQRLVLEQLSTKMDLILNQKLKINGAN